LPNVSRLARCSPRSTVATMVPIAPPPLLLTVSMSSPAGDSRTGTDVDTVGRPKPDTSTLPLATHASPTKTSADADSLEAVAGMIHPTTPLSHFTSLLNVTGAVARHSGESSATRSFTTTTCTLHQSRENTMTRSAPRAATRNDAATAQLQPAVTAGSRRGEGAARRGTGEWHLCRLKRQRRTTCTHR
jgi:hypothetical protein